MVIILKMPSTGLKELNQSLRLEKQLILDFLWQIQVAVF